MFETAFLGCAVIGGTIFLFQFVLQLIGLGDSDMELAEDVPELELVGDLDVDVDMDADVGGEGGVDTADGDSTVHADGGSGSALLRMLSVRTVTAALMFFGLSGLASLEAGIASVVALMIAIIVGMVALVIVHMIMATLYRLGHDGTVDIQQAVGRCATVYLPVPGGRDGAGKVQVTMRNRIMEYEAVTSNPDKLATGTKVVVVDVLGPSLVEVEPDSEVMASKHRLRPHSGAADSPGESTAAK
jgi:membrane protein implicated in regulation of membrane protease activity